jgi:UDP-GlcNAc3NAcA epimerase
MRTASDHGRTRVTHDTTRTAGVHQGRFINENTKRNRPLLLDLRAVRTSTNDLVGGFSRPILSSVATSLSRRLDVDSHSSRVVPSVKIVTIVGARPQFIKAWSVSSALRSARIDEVVVHTGQHYDDALSAQFFSELQLRTPDHHLGIGSGPHGQQTGRMLEGIERILQVEQPQWVIVYGDTNSTLAGALAAAKLHIPIAHVEAGLRSFNRAMPEEVNRVLTDHASRLLLCPSERARTNLAREGIIAGVEVVGDVMHASLRHFVRLAQSTSNILARLGCTPGAYHVATLHRAELTDDPSRLRSLLAVLGRLDCPVIMPLHPRTKARLESSGGVADISGGLRLIEPLGYLDMLQLVSHCGRVLTDSGGLQKEAYWLRKPCVTLRAETEWTETVEAGWNIVTDDRAAAIEAAVAATPPPDHPELYGDTRAAERIASLLQSRANESAV